MKQIDHTAYRDFVGICYMNIFDIWKCIYENKNKLLFLSVLTLSIPFHCRFPTQLLQGLSILSQNLSKLKGLRAIGILQCNITDWSLRCVIILKHQCRQGVIQFNLLHLLFSAFRTVIGLLTSYNQLKYIHDKTDQNGLIYKCVQSYR